MILRVVGKESVKMVFVAERNAGEGREILGGPKPSQLIRCAISLACPYSN